MKALGASGRRVFAIYLTQVLLLALVGGIIGAVVGATLPFLIWWTFGAIIPLPIVPALHPGELALAIVYGVLTALAFALWPLGRAHDVPVGALFRDMVAPQPRWPRKTLCRAYGARLLSLSRRSPCCWPMTGGSPSSTSARPRRCSCCCAWSPRC